MSKASRPSHKATQADDATVRRPYRYAITVVLLTTVMIAIGLFLLDSKTPAEAKLTGIAAGLAASAIFAVIYSSLANREFSELIRTQIQGQLTEHLTLILQRMAEFNTRYLPSATYPAGKDFDDRFNRDLTNDLVGSREYYFRGTSAKYVSARLRQCDHHLEDVKVLLIDPRNAPAIHARAQDLRRRPEHRDQAFPLIEQQIKDQILMSIVALFDCRDLARIMLGLTAETSPQRLELFDEAIYVSLYQSPDSRTSTHPVAVRYTRESESYEINRDEFRRQLTRASAPQTFTPDNSDADLLCYLSEIGFPTIEAAHLSRLRQEHAAFAAPLLKRLSKIGINQ